MPASLALSVFNFPASTAALQASTILLAVFPVGLAPVMNEASVGIVSTTVLFVLLRRRLGRLDGARIASSVVRIVVACALVAVVAGLVWTTRASQNPELVAALPPPAESPLPKS